MSALLVETVHAVSLSWLEAGLTVVTIVITILGTMWKMKRASEQDIAAKLVKKLDVIEFEKTCQMQEKEALHLGERITAQEKATDDKYKILDKKLDKIDDNVSKLIDFHLNEK